MERLDDATLRPAGTHHYPRPLLLWRCEDCGLQFAHDRDGKVVCPRCGGPPARGIPVGSVTVHR